jgi:hypothetical protein
MGQMTIYLDPETEKRVRLATSAEKISRSKWIARLIDEKLRDRWPAGVAELAGAWGDSPLDEEPREGRGGNSASSSPR